jgi:streptogramin lyase
VGLTIGSDGEVVMFASVTRPPYPTTIDRIYVLGEVGTEPLPGVGDADIYWMDSAADDDGVLWVYLGQTGDGGRLGRFDGSTWTMPTWPNGSGEVHAIEATSDGAVWVTLAGNSSGRPKVARIEDGVWTVLPVEVDGSRSGSNDGVTSSYLANGRSYVGYASDFAAAADGTAWLAKGDGAGWKLPPGTEGLLHFDGERWEVVDLPLDPSMAYVGPLALGPDGTLWVYAATEPSGRSVAELARLRDGEWTVYTEADGVPVLARYNMHSARLAVDGEGTLWVAFNGDPVAPVSLPPPLGPSDPPHGVLSFDGATWRQYLKGQDVNSVAAAPDGSIWVTSLMDCTDSPECRADEVAGGGLYVITPEPGGDDE